MDVSDEEEDEIIDRTALLIHRTGMDVAAILALESAKPLAYVGGQMGRMVLSPFLMVLGGALNELGEKLFTVFEKSENVEKLVQRLEDLNKD